VQHLQQVVVAAVNSANLQSAKTNSLKFS